MCRRGPKGCVLHVFLFSFARLAASLEIQRELCVYVCVTEWRSVAEEPGKELENISVFIQPGNSPVFPEHRENHRPVGVLGESELAI